MRMIVIHAVIGDGGNSALFFGGNRDSASIVTAGLALAAMLNIILNVHHRHPGDHTQLVTLCAGCHARVH